MKSIAIALRVFVIAATTATTLVIGCSSSNSNSGGLTCGISGGTMSSTCSSCVQSNCGSDYSNVVSACSAFISCVDACDCTETCFTSCESKITANPGCESAGTAVASCEMSMCKSECNSSITVTGGSPDAGGGGAATTVICNSALTNECTITNFTAAESAEAAAIKASCPDEQGTIVTACPTAKLVGCCKAAGGSSESCFYTGSASDMMMSCTAEGGTWSTSQ